MFNPLVDHHYVVAEACLDGQRELASDERAGVLPLLVHSVDRRHSARLDARSLKGLTCRPIGNPLPRSLHNGLSHIRRPDQPRS